MIHLANLCLFTILFLNLIGLALVTGFWLRNAWLALTAGPWLFCSVGFFIESFHGFGALGWVWPFTTAFSVMLILEVTGRTGYLQGFDKWLNLVTWKTELSPRLVPTPYLTLMLLFGYAMMWRYVFPNIDASSEKIADLAFVCNYYPGGTLPAHDVWFYPYLSTNYYSFQYYAAALLGRILGIEPGAAYNISFCVLIGMAFTSGVGAVCQATKTLWIRLLVSAGWIFGGSGVTILTHFLGADVVPIPCNNFRYIGTAALTMNQGPLGAWLANYNQQFVPPGSTVPMDLPGEQMSYSTFLGDYHPPLSGFYLLGLVLLAFNLWSKGASRWLLFIVGASLPWCAVADTWNLPLMVLGLGSWAVYHYGGRLISAMWHFSFSSYVSAFRSVLRLIPPYTLSSKAKADLDFLRRLLGKPLIFMGGSVTTLLRIMARYFSTAADSTDIHRVRLQQAFDQTWGDLRYVLGGAIAAMIAVFPYFLAFAYAAETYHSALKWVSFDLSIHPWDFRGWGFHTPPLLWFLFLFPTIGLTLLALVSRNKTLAALGFIWWGYLFFTEFFYINDIYSGPYIRFNTTLKWWPWVEAGALLTLGPKLLELRPRSLRWYAALILIAYPLGYIYDLGRAWTYLPWANLGQLNGSAYYESTSEHANGQGYLLNYLKLQPKGVVAEHPENDFSNDGAMPLFAGQPAYLGWLGHEQLWRGYLPELQYRRDQLESFYGGNMANAGEWMRTQGIDYILWFKTDVDVDTAWDKANISLGNDYYWHEFYRQGDHRVGLWERRK